MATSGHMSPFEHCARAMSDEEFFKNVCGKFDNDDELSVLAHGWSGNFRGFLMYRKMFANENITK